ncbi:MAG: hypothetical protein AAF602_14205 [Myxococcota bacterium]
MIGLLAGMAAFATPPDAWGRAADGDVLVLRPVGTAFEGGFDNANDGDGRPFDRALEAALAGIENPPDFVLVFLSEGQPRLFPGAFAFNATFNRTQSGTGRSDRSNERVPIRSGLYLNRTDAWFAMDPRRATWIFNHEVGHYWLAKPRADLGDGRTDRLLGRGRSHWNYFLDTDGSPLEGNDWVDNGDGTFTTRLETGFGGFSDLDLYLMGLLAPEEVRPFFVIDPDDPEGRDRASPPDVDFDTTPTTVAGTRIEVSIDAVIAAEGPVTPAFGEAPTAFTALTVLVAAPEEVLGDADFERIRDLTTRFFASFGTATRERASMSVQPPAPPLTPPPIDAPRWVPRGAR